MSATSVSPLSTVAAMAAKQAVMLKTMTRAGVVRPHNPARLAKVAKRIARHGIGFSGGVQACAALLPDQVAIIDEIGSITWREVDERSTRLAHSLRARGVKERDCVAVLLRNHRYFLEVSTAVAKLGADILYLNTSFSAPQIGEVCGQHSPAAVIYDDEFSSMIDKSGVDARRVIAWRDDAGAGSRGVETVEQLITVGSSAPLPATEHLARPVILTSGTTGTPKGAPRSEAGIDGAVALLARMPFKAGDKVHIAAPLFHTWGWAHLNLGMLLGTTMVLRRRFDPEEALRTIDEHDCDAMIAIPVMLQRILALPEDKRAGDYSQLRVVAASGSALPGDLATKWMDTFGDNLYNTYGSTEIAWATIATPADMRAAPGTAGRTPPNTDLKILDDNGKELPTGEAGRIFVGNSMLFGGYTGGGHKEVIDGLMSSGDVGRVDEEGRLFVEGRDDEMIVSGGENVFPKEVEDCIARHGSVYEVAAIGVEDDNYGKRLRAFVVANDGASIDEDDIKAWVKDNLARYKVPREVIVLDELPRNATGKVLKRELVDYEV